LKEEKKDSAITCKLLILISANIDRYGSSLKLGVLKTPAGENSDSYVDDNYDTKLSSGLELFDIY
jgi:hypothetical protein